MNHASPNPAAPSRIQRILSAVYRKGTTVAVLAGVSLLLIFAARAISPRHGLQGRYYANENWADAPVSTSLDPVVSFQKPAITAKTGNADKSSVVWEGIIHAPKSATYRFSVSSDDGSWVYIDGLLVIDNKGIHPASRVEKDVALAKGNHRLLIKYFDAGGEGSIDFNWRAMGSAARFMPRLFLYPRPVGSGLVILDTVLLLLILILKAVFVLSGLMLLALVPRAAGGLSSKLKRLWEKGRARLNAFLATGPKRLIPVGAIWIGLFILILTV